MGVFSGSISYSKFYVRGQVPKRFQQPFMKSIRLRAFIPLSVDEEAEEHLGWCCASNVLDLELTQGKVIFDRYLTLGLRTDKWRIPRALFNAHYEQGAAELKARTGKERLSKADKEELKFRTNRRLRKKLLPAMRLSDLCWDLERGVVLFWNRSPRAKEDLAVLFEQTFGLELAESSPYLEAKECLSEAAMTRLQAVEPSSFLSK